MKFCPKCKTNYTDETLRFCLADGASLISMSNAEKTVEMTGVTNPMRFDVPPPSEPTVFAPAQRQETARRSGINPWLVVPLLGILTLAVAGLLGYILLKPTAETIVSNQTTPTPAPSSTTAPDRETAAIKEELESLKKQLADQKNPQKSDSPVRPFPNQNPSAPIIQTARANSPNDGFLALRSIPDSKNGLMLVKIPHGTNLEIIGCQKSIVQLPGKRRGRWCRTNYNGQSGWVFDAFLSY